MRRGVAPTEWLVFQSCQKAKATLSRMEAQRTDRITVPYLAENLNQKRKDVPSIVDAEQDGDGMAQAAADGEGEHEGAEAHFERSGRENEGAERHRWGQDGGKRDGEDGVRLHPVGDPFEDAFGSAFLDEGEAAGLSDAVGEPAAESGAGGGGGDEQDGVGMLGSVEDEQDVSDAGDGERDEGAIDDGDEEEAEDSVGEEELDEVAVGMRRGRGRGGQEGEDGVHRG